MPVAPPLADTPAFHPDLVAAVRVEAGRSADRVADFLRGAGVTRLSRETLLELSAALTLASWEEGGLGLGGADGLPDAPAAFRAALATVAPHARPPGMAALVVGAFAERTAWAARPLLDADVRLDAPADGVLVEAVAQYLFARRRAEEPR